MVFLPEFSLWRAFVTLLQRVFSNGAILTFVSTLGIMIMFCFQVRVKSRFLPCIVLGVLVLDSLGLTVNINSI